MQKKSAVFVTVDQAQLLSNTTTFHHHHHPPPNTQKQKKTTIKKQKKHKVMKPVMINFIQVDGIRMATSPSSRV